MPKLTGYFKPVNQDEEEGQMSSVPSGSGAGRGASEPSRHMSGSDSDGVAGEEKQTGGTLSVGGDGEDDEDLLRGGEPTATGQIHEGGPIRHSSGGEDQARVEQSGDVRSQSLPRLYMTFICCLNRGPTSAPGPDGRLRWAWS